MPLGGLLYAIIALQALGTFVAGLAAWRAASAARAREDAPAVAAPLAPAPSPGAVVRSPSLELHAGSTLSSSPVAVRGEAPYGEFVAVVVGGRTAGVGLVSAARFEVGGVAFSPGENEVSVIAYSPTGPAVESVRVRVRYEPSAAARVEPATTPEIPITVPEPLARPSPTRSPVIASLRTPTPSPRSTLPPVGEPGRRARNILRGPAGRHIALTFDGGSHATQATSVLDALSEKGVRSTIFLTGEFIRGYPAITRRIVTDGHEIGNHTYRHPHLADWDGARGHVTRRGVTREVLLEELGAAERAFEETTGVRMSRYWRAPYGEINAQILGWAEEAGWVHVGWTQGLDTLDWVADPSDRLYRSAREIRDRILAAARSGEPAKGGIVLMHLGGERNGDQPVEELPRIIDGLRAEGYRLVTVSSLIGG